MGGVNVQAAWTPFFHMYWAIQRKPVRAEEPCQSVPSLSVGRGQMREVGGSHLLRSPGA